MQLQKKLLLASSCVRLSVRIKCLNSHSTKFCDIQGIFKKNCRHSRAKILVKILKNNTLHKDLEYLFLFWLLTLPLPF
jgi:hypothetical protein